MKKRCNSLIRNFLIAVFCTFTAFSHCLFGYASNDDEYITFNTSEMMQAYRYFYLYGLRADKSNTYTDTYSTTGSINLGNVNISLSSNGSMGGSGTSASTFEGMWHSFVGTGEDSYTLDIANSTIAHVDPTNTTPSHLTLACTFSSPTQVGGAADYEYHNLSCSDPNFTDIGRYNVTLNNVNDAITITGSRADTYAIFRSTANPNYDAETNSDLSMYSADSFTGSLSFNSSGGLSGSGSISATTTTTNTNKLNYVLPIMSTNSVIAPRASGNYIYRFFSNNPFVIAFLTDNYINGLDFQISRNSDLTQLFPASDYFQRCRDPSEMYNGGFYLVAVETKNVIDNGFWVNHFSNSYFQYGIIPLYVGYKNYMSDDMYRFIYGENRIIDAINKNTQILTDGNATSQNKGTELSSKTSQMSNQMNTFQNIEDTAGDNMNAALQNIDTNPSLISNNKFLMSVDWIRQQYNRLVTNTPFEAVITFCLVFGLGLLLLGKVR